MNLIIVASMEFLSKIIIALKLVSFREILTLNYIVNLNYSFISYTNM